jgi:PTS system nitrogen regulatory IIA component
MYLNIIQLAESMGVEESVVEGWIRNEGLPCVRDSGRLLFDRGQIVVWATERGLAARAGFLAAPRGKGSGISLDHLLEVGGIWRDVPPDRAVGILEQVLERLPGTNSEVRKVLASRLRSPDGITWAPVGKGWALPHLRTHVALGRDAGVMALLSLAAPLALPDPPADGVPVTKLVFFLAPSPRAHLELLAQLSTALSRGPLGRLAIAQAPDKEIHQAVISAPATREASA